MSCCTLLKKVKTRLPGGFAMTELLPADDNTFIFLLMMPGVTTGVRKARFASLRPPAAVCLGPCLTGHLEEVL